MVILVAFLLPVVAFVVASRVLGRNARYAARAGAVAIGAAALATGAVFATITRTAFWSERTQVAWIGIESGAAREPLVVGGPAESAAIGWPTAGFWPQLTATPLGGSQVRLQIGGGAGVVVVEDAQRALNGTAIAAGQAADVEGFRVSYEDRWFFDDRVSIAKDGGVIARVPLRWGRSNVISILPELANAVARLRSQGDAPAHAVALQLEDWATNNRLYRDGDSIRVVSAVHGESPSSWSAADVGVPARITVRWPGRVLPMEIAETADGRVKLTFLPPWRLASPMPPPVDDSGDIPLTLTTDPRPWERVFHLPFGPSVQDPRRVLKLRTGTQPQFVGGRVQRLDEVIDLPPGVRLDDDVRRFRPAGLTSMLGVPVGPLSLQMATVQDLPTPGRLALILAIGLAVFCAGVAFTQRVLPSGDTWPLYGLALCLWLFLCARLLLSIRYAGDPTGLDQLAVKGVALAALALAVLPGLFFITVRLYRDAFLPRERKARARTFYLFATSVATIAFAAWLQVRTSGMLWPNLPERFAPDLGWMFVILLGVAFLVLLVQGAHTYLLEADAQARLWWLSPLSVVQKAIFGYGVRFWQKARVWRAARGRRFVIICIALFLAYGAVAMLFAVLNFAAGNQRIVQELVGPFVLTGIPLLLWLASRAAVTVGRIPILADWKALLFLSAVTVFPAILSPIFLGDVGGILASLAWFIPLAALLLAVAPRRYGVFSGVWSLVVVALAAGFLVASVTILPGAAVSVLERGVSRYLVFARGLEAQRLLPLAQWSPELGEGVPLRSLQNTIEHGWENVAIAHRGRWMGTGFSKAPTRRSMVPQETLQYDSTFSFFIVSEHGVVGGFALMLLYAAPLAIVLWSARRRFDVGHVLAAVIAAAFLGEALLHAAMNYGALPFTGRNLPLLSVNSATEVLRWSLLWCLAGQALLWRSAANDRVFSPRYGAAVARTAPAESGRIWRLCAAAVLAIPLLFAVAGVVVPAIRVATNRQLDASFGWDRLLATVQTLIDANRIVWEPDKKQISLKALGVALQGTTFLEQEVARFNSLPDDEKYDLPERVSLPLGRITTLPEYDAALHSLWKVTSRVTRRPPLFIVTASERRNANDEEPERVERLEANPAFNIQLSFTPHVDPFRLPQVVLPGATQKRDVHLLGPAWVSGRWEVGINPEARVPWARALAGAMATEWSRHGAEQASQRFGRLTIDAELQRAAMDFAAEKGRTRHGELLATFGGTARRQLPPRVALSVIDMKDGRVLAQGGWPRMSPGTRWTWGAGGWSPPADWLERHASRAIALRYDRDRNFDRIEVGSGGKPFWAAAALSVHPQLDRLLRVQGGDVVESDVFGIPIQPKGWKVLPSPWRDFREYMMRSDNRYHVRVGFLGVAAGDGRRIHADRSAGRSPSIKESLAGANPAPWGYYPQFLPDVAFSPARPDRMTLLHQTPLAQALYSMFNAGIHAGDTPTYRLSLWSLVEGDAASAHPVSDQFLSISPESTQLRLDAVSTPRQYVSHLLGGNDSRWSNVEYAAAFATAVTGHPLVPHVINGETKARDGRQTFPEIAARLRPGLTGVVRDDSGTATARLRQAGATLAFAPNLNAYGKTGTLSTDLGKTETSRLVVALVRWKDQSKGIVDSGVVLSLVVERAEMGSASTWLGEFIARYGPAISRAALK